MHRIKSLNENEASLLCEVDLPLCFCGSKIMWGELLSLPA